MKLLFVCLGNICRSPTAHGVVQQKFTDIGLDWIQIDSAGTAAYHIGNAPDPRSQKAAAEAGYDLSSLRARQVCEQDYFEYDYIFAMDRVNLADLEAQRPADSTARIELALAQTRNYREDVPDPYYGGEDGFKTVINLCEEIADSLIDRLGKGSRT